MVFKPVTGNATDIKKMKDKPLTGSYTGKSDITTKIGPQVIWQFVDEDEQPFGIYGFTNLNRIMTNVKEGSLCRITYKGTQNVQTKFGMRDVHQVLVEIDDENTTPIGAKVSEKGDAQDDDIAF